MGSVPLVAARRKRAPALTGYAVSLVAREAGQFKVGTRRRWVPPASLHCPKPPQYTKLLGCDSNRHNRVFDNGYDGLIKVGVT